MPLTYSTTVLASIVLASVVNAANAQTIDFESIPGAAPADGLSISNQFAETSGVIFSLANGSNPVLAQVGPPQTAFQGFGFAPDQPAPGTNVGQFFLTDDGVVGPPPSTLLIDYLEPVAAASGVILDIDGTEEWTLEAFDGAGNVLATVVLGQDGTLDGSATLWAFDEGVAVIEQISLRYTGIQNIVGLAFDNFSPSSLPPDTDEDGVLDPLDNCVLVSNSGQQDTDGDNIGNVCDFDLSQDCNVNVIDLGLLRQRFFSNDSDADFNSDGVVNVIDLGLMRTGFFGAPGPSGLPNACGDN